MSVLPAWHHSAIHLKCRACEVLMQTPALIMSRLYPFPPLLPHPLHPCVLPRLLSPVVLSCLFFFSLLEWGCLTALLSSSLVLQDATGLPNQLQWGALQRLSLPGRNCAVIELRDNNTFFSLISYQRWIINTIIIVPSHQQCSTYCTLPRSRHWSWPALSLCSFRFSLTLISCSRFTYFIPIFFSLSLFCQSVLATICSLSSASSHPSHFPFHFIGQHASEVYRNYNVREKKRVLVRGEGRGRGGRGREDN